MSTTLLYHAFSVRGYKYVRSPYGQEGLTLTIDQERADWLLLQYPLMPHRRGEPGGLTPVGPAKDFAAGGSTLLWN